MKFLNYSILTIIKTVNMVKANLRIVYAYTMYVEGNQIFYGVDAYPSSDIKNHSTVGSMVGTKDRGEQDLIKASDQNI